MAKTIATAKANYARRTQAAGPRYEAAKGRAKAGWAAGMSEFLGGPVGSSYLQAYNSGIDAAHYRPGNPDKWEAGMLKMRS